MHSRQLQASPTAAAAGRSPCCRPSCLRRAPLCVVAASSSSSSSSPFRPLDAVDAEWRNLRKPAVLRATGVRAADDAAAAAAACCPSPAPAAAAAAALVAPAWPAASPAVGEFIERLNASLRAQRDVYIITFGGGAGVYTLSSSSPSSSNGGGKTPAAATTTTTATTTATTATATATAASASAVRETVLAFEGADDAERYATLLEAVLPGEAPGGGNGGGPPPRPEVFALPRGDVGAFCRSGGYALRLHPAGGGEVGGGALLLPPEATLRLMFDLEDLRPAEETRWT